MRSLVFSFLFSFIPLHLCAQPDELQNCSRITKSDTPELFAICIQALVTEARNFVNNETKNTVLMGFERFSVSGTQVAKDQEKERIWRQNIAFPKQAFQPNETIVVSVGIVGIEFEEGRVDLQIRPVDVSSNGFTIEAYGDDNMKYGDLEIQWLAIGGNATRVSGQQDFVD